MGGDGVRPPKRGDVDAVGADGTIARTEEWLRSRGFAQVLPRSVRRRALLQRTAPMFGVLFVISLALSSTFALLNRVLERTPIEASTFDLTTGEIAAVSILTLTPIVAIATGVGLARLLTRLPPARSRLVASVIVVLWLVHPFVTTPPRGVADVVELALGQVVMSVLVVGLTYLGVGTVLAWSAWRALAEVGSMLPMAVRVLPVLLLTVLFLFFNSDVWMVVTGLDTVRVLFVALILVGFTVAVAIVTTVDELRHMKDEGHDDWHGLRDSPVAGRTPQGRAPALSRGERINLAVIPVTALLAQVLGFVLLTFAFFVLFGQLSISDATTQAWTRQPAARAVLFDTDLPWTVTHLKVATILSTFSGLSVAASASADATYRSRYLEPILAEVRDDLAVRHAYLELLEEESRRKPDPDDHDEADGHQAPPRA